MENEKKILSIIIPCRNEEKFIGKCLDSVAAQDYPKENFDVLAVDGMSDDGTRKIIGDYREKFPFIKLLDNPEKFTPFAMNIGIKNAKGDFIIFMGAHAEYALDYVSRCVTAAEKSNADNVGGIAKISSCQGLPAKAIAGVLSSPFGAGDARYKTLLPKEPIETDTVFGGCYKKEVFSKIGLFDERMIRSQDMEFNMRLKKAGGKIMLFPDIVVNYYPKSNFREFFVHNFWDGVWAIWPLRIMKTTFKLRHYLPLFFVLSFLGLGILSFIWQPFLFLLFFEAGLYFVASIYFSAKISFNEKEWRLLFFLPIAFAARHFGYGVGSVFGLIKLLSKDNGAFSKKS
ncbi:MAG: hypothetical protein YFSK_0890 [Candidatus Yanofskyibacterium parasiticum]|jgi:glycosyltransferase involved in cell wall biosynthesis|nr:MAG: hypothetical protein YFSK_0890 [Candidatus Yanofskybacteria bacterium]